MRDIPERYRAVEYEYFEPSPFLRHPLIRHDDMLFRRFLRPCCLSRYTTFVYDALRRENAQEFMNKFGPMFEGLVGRSVTSVQNVVLREDDLKRHFSDSANQQYVDFLVVEKECNIFIEAKAVAMSLQGMVTDRPGTVRTQTKASSHKGSRTGICSSTRASTGRTRLWHQDGNKGELLTDCNIQRSICWQRPTVS